MTLVILMGRRFGFPTFMPRAFKVVRSRNVPRRGDRVALGPCLGTAKVVDDPVWHHDLSRVEVQLDEHPVDDYGNLHIGWFSKLEDALWDAED